MPRGIYPMEKRKGLFKNGHQNHLTKESKRKMGEAKKGRKRPLFSEEWRKKMGDSRTGENHWNWKGGSSKTYIMKNLKKTANRPKPEQCEICGALGMICFDHDHQTNKFRGWICKRCNVVLGLAMDNTELLNKMIEYIKK